MRALFITVLVLIFLGMFTQSCKECEPIPGSVNTLKITFYSYDSLISETSSRSTLTMTYDEVSALGTDSVFYDATNLLSSFDLSLSNLENTTTFTFSTGGMVDSLQVDYVIQTIVEGPDCGVREAYNDLVIGKSTFDSVVLVKDQLELGDALHLEVFERE